MPGTPWAPPPATSHTGARVLLLDNRDSFTWNLAHDLLALGARVDVRGQHESLDDLLGTNPDAVLVGPGPGTPDTSGVTLALTRACLDRRIPLLGVCLGHQALGQVLGGRVERAQPVHGRPEYARHDGSGLFRNVPPDAPFGYVVTPNADHLTRLRRHPTLRPLYDNALLRVLDSRVVALLGRGLGLAMPTVATGSDVTAHLLADHACRGERVTIIGLDSVLPGPLAEAA